MKPCLNQATTMPSSFQGDVVAYDRSGFEFIEVWLTKLEDFLEGHSLGEARRLLSHHGLTPLSACYQGGLLLTQGERRATQWDQFQQRLELCAELGIPVLVVTPDFIDKPTSALLQTAVDGLAQATEQAQTAGVTLALEFLSHARLCSTLETAAMMVRQVNSPHLGLVLDVFHFYVGPSKFDDLDLLEPGMLKVVHLSDCAGVPREVASNADRILPGEGTFRLEPILKHLERLQYDGPMSVELYNRQLWEISADQVADAARGSLRRLLEPESYASGSA